MEFGRSIFTIICLLVIMAGCQTRHKVQPPVLNGVYDGYSYTSPEGSFSIYLKNHADLSSMKDEIIQPGVRVRFSYTDTDGNFYGILVTHTGEPLPENFAEEWLKQHPDESSNVRKNKTPDGSDCIVATYLPRSGNSEKGSGRINIIFAKKRTIFEVMVISKPMEGPAGAEKAVKEAVYRLWANTVFRDQPDDIPGISAQGDPRVSIMIYAAQRAAEELKLKFKLQTTPKPILRISMTGEAGRVTLSIGIKQGKTGITFTEAIACNTMDRDMAVQMQKKYFMVLGRILAEEKLSLKRDLSDDPDLL